MNRGRRSKSRKGSFCLADLPDLLKLRPLITKSIINYLDESCTNFSYFSFASFSAFANNAFAFSGLERASEL